jgi:hypothetical protein
VFNVQTTSLLAEHKYEHLVLLICMSLLYSDTVVHVLLKCEMDFFINSQGIMVVKIRLKLDLKTQDFNLKPV